MVGLLLITDEDGLLLDVVVVVGGVFHGVFC